MFGTKPELAKQNLIKCLDICKNIKMKGLLQSLIRRDVIMTESVCKSMANVDRGEFTDSEYAYSDMAQGIDYGATISAPHMHAMALEYLKDFLKPGNKILDVGSGSGYMVVAFSKMMDDKGTVVGIEHIPELYQKGVENISKSHSNLIQEGKVVLKEGDGRKGSPEYAPFNCIHVGAAAEKVPKDLIDQLAPGGRIMIPVGKYYQYIYLIDKDLNGKITKDAVSTVRFVPLTDKEKQLANAESNIFGF